MYWVYVTYLLLFDLSDKDGQTILSRCREARAHLESEKIGCILKLNSRMDRMDAIREYCFKLREKLYGDRMSEGVISYIYFRREVGELLKK